MLDIRAYWKVRGQGTHQLALLTSSFPSESIIKTSVAAAQNELLLFEAKIKQYGALTGLSPTSITASQITGTFAGGTLKINGSGFLSIRSGGNATVTKITITAGATTLTMSGNTTLDQNGFTGGAFTKIYLSDASLGISGSILCSFSPKTPSKFSFTSATVTVGNITETDKGNFYVESNNITGTLNEISLAQGSQNLTLSGISFDASQFYSLAKSQDYDALYLSLLAGNDTMSGSANVAYIFNGYDGADSITGNNSNDSISGGSGNDTINGLAGNDTLVGGEGNDVLSGGLGADTFVLAGNDTVVDYNGTQSDVLNFESLANGNTVTLTTVTGALNLSISNSTAAFKATTAATATTITGGAGADTLNGGAGADRLSGGVGDDSISGGAGADTITGGQGNDLIVLTESTSAADVVLFAGGTGTAGSTRVGMLGLDTITGINLGTATTAVDKLQFSAADFGIAAGSAVRGAAVAVTGVSANTDGNFYIVTAAPTGSNVDLNGTATGSSGAIVFLGANTGTAGVDVWFTTNEASFSTSTAVKIATLVGISTANINATDLAFVA